MKLEKICVLNLNQRLDFYFAVEMYFSVLENERHKENGILSPSLHDTLDHFSREVKKTYNLSHRDWFYMKKFYKENRNLPQYKFDLKLKELTKEK